MQTDSTRAKEGVAAFFGQTSGAFGHDDSIRRFPHFGRRLVEVAGVPASAQVLDVATGRGAVLFPAAERVGAKGSVLGIDIAPGMVDATARDIEMRGLKNASVQMMDAERLDLPAASFDVVLCAFGIMFLPHLADALVGFRRVLRPGGILAVSTWGQPDPNFEWERELQQTYGIADRNAQSFMVQRLGEANELADALRAAGFSDVNVVKEADERVHRDPEQWWSRILALGANTKAALESLGPDRMATYKKEAFEKLLPLTGPAGISQRIEANFGLARNP
jgi:ubiquinone/menaquinone biosynthesis C-methylase UbiE